ncbi:MAG: UDPglucose 6-dehydrogenase, partial [Microbacteriaceae bacterium]|nr:UDPglucose 6-dehydrogenase [Microbacteriaceae bacterium]
LGAEVVASDPQAIETARRRDPQLRYLADVEDAVRGADAVLLLTEWKEYRDLDPDRVGSLVARKSILDGRNCLDPVQWRAAGWQYRALGRP